MLSKLQIQGKGLDAIIRDTKNDSVIDNEAAHTARDEMRNEMEAAKRGFAQQKEELEKAATTLQEELTLLRQQTDEAVNGQKEAQKLLAAELARVQKIVNDDYPSGAAQGVMIDTLIARAKTFEETEENLLDAFHLYRRVIRLDPTHLPTLYALATLYYSADLAEKAAEVLAAIIELAPKETRAHDSLSAIRGDDE